MRLTLSSIHKYQDGSGEDERDVETTLWQDQYTVPDGALTDRSPGIEVRVHFHIPSDQHRTRDPGTRDEILWRLDVAAANDYRAQFVVPVFWTEESSEELDAERPPRHRALSDASRAKRPRTRSRDVDASVARIEHLPGGIRIVFRVPRTIVPALVWTMSLLVTGGIAILGIWAGMWYSPIVIINALCALLSLPVVAGSWFSWRRIDIISGELSLTYGLFGRKSLNFPKGSVRRLRAVLGMQVGDTHYSQILITTRDGERHTLAFRIDGRETAEQLIAVMQKALR